MSQRFRRGLAVGKFSPLHRGHEALIRRAIECCDEVLLISYSQPELPGCDAERRDRWLSSVFPGIRHVAVTDQRLRAWGCSADGLRKVPRDDASAATHRRFCALLCLEILGGPVDAVFTGEKYGDGFAEELTRCFRERETSIPRVTHVSVNREAVPISGTEIRRDVDAHREWLAPVVYGSFVRRVCLLGGESTGKSTLAVALARVLDTAYVAEYGRELWDERTGRLTFEDMRRIAEVQVSREEEAAPEAHRYLFCDTSPLTTLFYSREMFGKAEPELERLANRAYDFTVLCMPDFAFVQDGTRQPESFRQRQHEWYVRELATRRIPYVSVLGPVEARVMQIVDLLP